MCGTCGCTGESRTVVLQQKVLGKNDDIAERNRAWLARRGVTMVNLMSSPGAGKTTLLERIARFFTPDGGLCVIEGDQETALDADRVKAAGCDVVQVNTGVGCHLDAEMVRAALDRLDPVAGSLVLIENVGNLVCPALFDLGEAGKVVLASVTEGGDKPLKYPHMFRQADLVLVSKVDLLPYVDFDLASFAADVQRISPKTQLMALSAITGEGVEPFCDWLSALQRCPGGRPPGAPRGRARQPQPLGPG